MRCSAFASGIRSSSVKNHTALARSTRTLQALLIVAGVVPACVEPSRRDLSSVLAGMPDREGKLNTARRIASEHHVDHRLLPRF